MKTCKKCHRRKPITQFSHNKTKPDGLQVDCKVCCRKRHHEHYQKNKIKIRRQIKETKRKHKTDNIKRFAQFLLSHPCVDCGETDLVLLDCDHLGDKICDVSTMVSKGYTWAKVQAEIKKCVVRCSRCHRLKTAKEQNSWRWRMRNSSLRTL